MTEIIAPDHRPLQQWNKRYVFLAGSIDMGKSRNWQKDVVDSFKDYDNLVFYNPLRQKWDNSWEQSIENSHLVQQVEWELSALEDANYIIVNFEEDSQSPITMLELGRFYNKNILVSCPKGFYRRGNIEIFCKRYGIDFFENLEDLTNALKNQFKTIWQR